MDSKLFSQAGALGPRPIMGVATYTGEGAGGGGGDPSRPAGGYGEKRCRLTHRGLERSPRSKRFFALEKLRSSRGGVLRTLPSTS